MNTEKKIALVTGASRGIGFEVCKQLLAKGFHVILSARNEQKGRAACDLLQSPDAEFYPLDVTNQSDIDALTDYLRNQYKRCDVLVNNAGIFPDPREDSWPSILNADIDTIKTGMETNAYGLLRMCQAIIPLMQKNNYGRIVNLSSGMGQLSDMNGCCPGYRISKTSVNVITRVIADELGDNNILINSMCPGWVKTDMGGAGATRELADGADTAIWLATLPDKSPSGLFFRDREPIPW